MRGFEWDEVKRDSNLELHGLDFADAHLFEWEGAHISQTYASRTGRRRLQATGLFFGQVITIVFSPLGTEAYSIVSMRHASRKERRRYEQQ